MFLFFSEQYLGGIKKENREVKYVNLFILLHAVAFLNPIKF